MEVFHRDRSTMDSELSPDFQSSHQPRLQLQDQASLFHFHQGTMSSIKKHITHIGVNVVLVVISGMGKLL